MVRMKFSIELAYEIFDRSADFIFNIEAAQTPHQTVVSEKLDVSQQVRQDSYTDQRLAARFLRLQAAAGPLTVRYEATVDINHHAASPTALQEMPISTLPLEALPYIVPSRYCQSDRLQKFATAEFGMLPRGYGRVKAIQEWVRNHVKFQSGSSNGSTSAMDTIIERGGVCRDFAHLMIALCRAVNIPARFVSGIDYGADPSLGPTDFHAYVEVMLSGRWYLFDPSGVSPPMGLVRLGTGRDAADAAFATVFGMVRSAPPVIQIEAITDGGGQLVMPAICDDLLSTSGLETETAA
ncbi:transglutaminase-like domain-containing protein [Noviherbaspirillum suwonense]|jgi:transglutaminase-like putative cysteine protease|uniref:Transglutaminase-like enzyme, putative cysteine protease n=1 Tax=Noviherbaspirillum suwonense TaxID=1224511 RepID=A0ABY1Q2L6_9BURK|nr:transglutaminase family protein [Noviherbaspirillum suwonense]SMP57313.1 Transglutaminase-like enzyme, putative cysteine protease [Noviherbaspirillum suwonense]